MLRLDEGRNQLGRTSERMIEDVSTLSNKCLKPAILAMVQGDPDKLNFKDDRAESFTADLSARVDEIFFPRLWSSATMDEDEAVRDWQETLVDLGREILRDAERSLPIPSARRYRALAVAEGIYSGSVRRQFPLLADGEVSQTQRRKTA
jgi:hypothetical protein